MKKFRGLIALGVALALLLTFALASGDKTMTLPKDLKVIEASAFEGNTSIERVVLPAGVEEIQAKAFAGSTLKQINLPDTLSVIADDAFDAPGQLEVRANKGSYAYRWAVDHEYIAEYPESVHPYEPNSKITWKYVHPTAAYALGVVFSPETRFEKKFDTLTVKDSKGNETVYTGDQLSGATLALPGNRFQLLLQSDDGGELYGFTVTDIYTMNKKEYEAFLEHERLYPFYMATLTDGTIVINGYKGSDAAVTIPDSVDGVAVTAIGDGAFKNRNDVTDVTIPASVNFIASGAFSGCDDLTIHADAKTYAGKWAATHGYAKTSEKLLVMPDSNDGRLSVQGGVYVWEGLSGSGEEIRFAVNASGDWSVTSGSKWLDTSKVPEKLTSDDKSIELYYKRNDTGTVRTATLIFACGDKEIKYRVSQLPYMSTSLKNAPKDMVYKAGQDIELEWVAYEGAASYEFYYCPHSYNEHRDYPVRVKNGVATVTIPALDLEPGTEGHEMYMYVVDEYGHRYESEVYRFYVHDSSNSNWGYRMETGAGVTSVIITQYYGKTAKLNVPATIGGYPVVEIESDAFEGNQAIKSVVVPEGVKTIGSYAFDSCRSLEKVTLPKSLRTIGYAAFTSCTSLTTINLPSGLTVIEGETFRNCKSLPDIAIPKTVKEIRYRAFFECTALTRLELPSGVNLLGDGVFEDCSGLEAVYISATVTVFGEGIFQGCDKLTVYGKSGSDAQQYAKDNGLKFKTGSIPQ